MATTMMKIKPVDVIINFVWIYIWKSKKHSKPKFRYEQSRATSTKTHEQLLKFNNGVLATTVIKINFVHAKTTKTLLSITLSKFHKNVYTTSKIITPVE